MAMSSARGRSQSRGRGYRGGSRESYGGCSNSYGGTEKNPWQDYSWLVDLEV